MANFEPLKQLFVDAHTLTKMKLQTLPHGPEFDLVLKQSGNLPLLPVTVASIEGKVARGVELTTKGDFSNALKTYRSCLQSITLMAVTTAAEQKTIQQLIKKIVEYITAMRIELERKKTVQQNPAAVERIAELGCYMTLCGMENAHKFLSLKNAFTFNYKNKNYITAAHFARQVVDLEATGVSNYSLFCLSRLTIPPCFLLSRYLLRSLRLWLSTKSTTQLANSWAPTP